MKARNLWLLRVVEVCAAMKRGHASVLAVCIELSFELAQKRVDVGVSSPGHEFAPGRREDDVQVDVVFEEEA